MHLTLVDNQGTIRPYGFVYGVFNRTNGKVYIGQTTYSVDYRWRKHKTHARKKKTVFADAIKAYGPDAFVVVEMGRAFSVDELNEMERRAVFTHDSCNREYGYNMEPGGLFVPTGNLGKKFSAEHRARISEALRGRKLSPEHCVKNGDAKRGKKHSEKSRANMRAAQKGRKHTAEARAKISLFNKGKIVSADSREKMKAAWAVRRERDGFIRDSRGRWVSQN